MNRPGVAIRICLLFTCPKLGAQQYPFIPVAGAPTTPNLALFQDSRGRLWIGGKEAACFDGVRFFPLSDYGFPSSMVYEIGEDSEGGIWIGAETGLYRFANGRVQEISKGVVTSVVVAKTDLVLAAIGPLGAGPPRKAALLRVTRVGGQWKPETVMDLDCPGPLALNAQGTVTYPFRSTASREIQLKDLRAWSPGTQVPVQTRGDGSGAPVNGVWKTLYDRAGCIWTSMPFGVVYRCGEMKGPAPGPGVIANVMHEADDGRMVIVGPSVLAIGRPGSFQVVTRANGLPGLSDAILARDGTVWLGGVDGLYRFASPFRIEYWTIRDGVLDPPWSLARVGSTMYAGLNSRIAALQADRSRWDIIATFPPRGAVSALLESGGNLLAAFQGAGAVELSPDGKVLAESEKDHPKGAMRLATGANGEIWVGGSGGLGSLSRAGKVLKFDAHTLEARPSGNVLSIKYDQRAHKLFSCYVGGLVVRDDGGKWSEYTTRDGLRSNECWSLAPLANGDVWYAYFQLSGMATIRPQPDGHIAVRDHAANESAEAGGATLDTDLAGRLWRTGDLAFYVAAPSQAEAGKWLPFDKSDGFPANGMNTGSVFADSDGSMWWGADNDLAHFKPPADLVDPEFAPQVFVSAYSWNNQGPRLAESVDRFPLGSKVTAHIGSLQFDRRNALRIRYRLLPGQTEWRETKNLDLPLGSLAVGRHTLEVQGRVFTGPWSATVSQAFTVLTPIWLAWPVLVGYLVTAGSLGAGGYVLHRRRKAENAKVLPDLSAWRMGALLSDVREVVGTVLDARFEIRSLLARGGFASVMAAYDRKDKQPCAVKIFRTEVKDKAWVQRSFDDEVAALRRVHHPNVVSIYAQGRTASGAPYLVMEFIKGRSLREVLDGGALGAHRSARMLRQLASALDAIHAEGICHRDVKPENVIVRKEGFPEEEAMLIDFSIALVKDADETLHGLSRAAGTFDYMAPEQAVGYAQTSSDVYSLAKLLIEMLTGRQVRELLPDAALDLPERVRALARSWAPGLSDESVEVLATALEFDPSRRPLRAGFFAAPLVRDLESRSAQRTL
jgi:hypothetical protein